MACGAGDPLSLQLVTTIRRPFSANWLQPQSPYLAHRIVVVLHHYEGIPLVEIAETLGIPVGTARSRLHYALKRLRDALEADTSGGRIDERTA